MILEMTSVLVGIGLASTLEVQSLSYLQDELNLDDIEFIQLLSDMSLEESEIISWQPIMLICFMIPVWFYYL